MPEISRKHAKCLLAALRCPNRADRGEKQQQKKVIEKSFKAGLGFTGLTTTTPFWVRNFLTKVLQTSIYTYIIHMWNIKARSIMRSEI
jgi:hypothetical protein